MKEKIILMNKNHFIIKEVNEFSNHAIAIVRWDDNYPKKVFGKNKPSKSGVWIKKSSWEMIVEIMDIFTYHMKMEIFVRPLIQLLQQILIQMIITSIIFSISFRGCRLYKQNIISSKYF